MGIEIRPATADDVSEMVEIENREILEGTAHFGTEPISLAEAHARFDIEKEIYPCWVAVDGDAVLGFARSGPWKTREAYQWTTEVGVYVRPEARGNGVAKLMYESFLPTLESKHFVTVLAGIALPNEASIRLHESFGFQHVGTLPKVGFKFGKWHDVGYWTINYPCNGQPQDIS